MMNKQLPIRLMRDGRFWAVSFLVLALVLLVGLTAFPVTAQESAPLPDSPPDAANGLTIYADRCANCHGPLGNGDGELAVNLPKPPRAFTDPTFRQTAVPASFYNFIFNGNLDAGMPGFGEGVNTRAPLSSAEIWDAIAAVMVLSTPQTILDEGQTLYADNCQSCHGETGLGDGPDAAGQDMPSLADMDYWFNRSNDVVQANLAPGNIEAHEYDLSDEELAAVTSYARTFSFVPAEAPAGPATIDAATITGIVTNATSGAAVGDVSAQLRAFSPAIQEMLALTETVGTDGSFEFTVNDVAEDWVYLVNVTYEGLNYSSEVGQISPENSSLDLPVTVYDQTTDASSISIAQVHVVFDFPSTDVLQVTELYVFNNSGTAVFVGESGNPDEGVARINVPANAENLNFQRAFNAMDSFIPATEVIPVGDSYADTIALRPGRSNSSLVVNFTLPYDAGAEMAHSLSYPANSVTLILPDAGVNLLNADEWTEQAQDTTSGMFFSYIKREVAAGTTLDVALEGEPEAITSTMGSSTVATPRNQSTELIIGGIALVLVGIAAVVIVRSRIVQRDEEDEYEYEEEEEEEAVVTGNGRTADELIQIIAALDDAYERGELEEDAYRQERAQLKAELKAVWQ